MLEHLGLGIVLTMEDNFTPQANKAVASMDRLERSAEDMTANVQKSLSNLQNLMLSGFSLDQIGGDFQRGGKKILGSFEKVFEGITKAGAKFETLRNTIKTFYKDSTDDAINWGLKFASRTPFEVEDTLNALKTMKAVGLDARKEFEYINAEGKKASKEFLSFIGDLGAFNPEQGIKGAMYAVRELMGGQVRSLKTRFDINPEIVLGRKINTSNTDQMQKDIVELISKIAPDMTKNLEGTFDQLMSNLGDSWNVFKMRIADAGAFKPVKQTLVDLITTINTLDIDKVAKPLGEIFASLWKPVDLAIKGIAKLVSWTVKFAEKHPSIAKMVLGFVAFNGVMLTLTGTIMKAFGSWMIMTTAIVSAYANLKLLKSLNIGADIAGITAGLGGFIRLLGIAGALVGAFALAWHNNFGGIRDKGISVANQLKQAWANSEAFFGKNLDGNNNLKFKMTVEGDPVPTLSRVGQSYEEVIMSHDKLARRIAQTRALFGGIFTALFGKKQDGKVIFSDEQITALKNTNMLGIVRVLVMARGRAEEFFKGFSKGIGTALVVGKKFLDIVLIPIKAVFKGMYIAMKPTFDLINKLFGNDSKGMDRSKAEQQMELFRKIGEVAGTAVGALLGFKIVRSLTSVITSPFIKLKDSLVKSAKSIDNLKTKMMGLKDVNTKSIFHKMFGKGDDGTYNSDKFQEVVQKYDKTPKVSGQKQGKYQRLYGNQVYDSFMTYNIKENDKANANEIYTKKKSKLGRLLFGDQYLSKGSDGSMNKIGKFGGLFNVDRDDKQIRLSAEHFTSDKRGGEIDKGKPSDYARKLLGYEKTRTGRYKRDAGGNKIPIFNDSGASALADYRSHIPNMNSQAGTVKTLFGDSAVPNNYRDLQKQYNKRFGVVRKDLGIDMRKFNLMGNETESERVYKTLMKGKAMDSIGKDSELSSIKSQMDYTKSTRNQAVYKSNRGKVSEALFGQRFYKIDRDAKGNLYENTVGRRGGIGRLFSNDMQYKEQGDTSLMGRARRAGGALADTRVGRGVTSIGSSIGTGVRNTRLAVGMRTSMLQNSLASSIFGKGFTAIGQSKFGQAMGRMNPMPFINKQMGRLGAGNMTGSKFKNAIFGRSRIDATTGKRVGGGLISKTVRGTGAVVRGTGSVVRGAGSLLGGALGMGMRALPFLALGGMAFKGIANKGASIQGKDREDIVKRNGLKGANDFTVGLAKLKEDVKKFSFKKMWDNLKVTGKDAWNMISDIGKTIWKEISDNGKTILGDAFTGIAGLADLAWTFIKEHAGDIIKNIAEGLGDIIGNAFKWLAENGSKAFGDILDFVIFTLIPSIFNGLVDLGSTIIANLPNLIKGIMDVLWTLLEFFGKLAWDLGGKLLDGICGAIANLGSAIGEIVIKGLTGLLKAVLPEPLEKPVFGALGLEYHHGGLWLSGNEHPAIIKKDETVLPSDKSRKLDNLLETVGSGSKVRTATAMGNAGGSSSSSTDNSITIQEVVLKFEGNSSRVEARQNAIMFMEELKKMQKEKVIRKLK